jgi:8-oxo-dGTP diphosphatase
MRTKIAELIRAISPLDELERQHISDTLAWIDSGAPLYRTARPATPRQHLVSYSVLFDQTAGQLLLLDHIDAGRWLPPGGHVEVDEHPATTALRELREELRLETEFIIGRPIFITLSTTIGKSAGHVDVSLWFAFRGDGLKPVQADPSECSAVQWFSLSALPSRTDPHLTRFARKLATLPNK